MQDEAYLRYLEQGRVHDYMTKAGVRWYVRSEEPAKGLVPSPSSCTGAVEPVQGRGPKSYVPVCPDDLVYRDVGSDYVWSVWRYRGGGR